jgi:hypothetical protein
MPLRLSLPCALALLASCVPAAVPCQPSEPPKGAPTEAASGMRPFYALPVIDARPGPFASEEELLATVARLYADYGFGQSGLVTLTHSDDVLVPFTSGSTIHSRRFLGDGPGVEQHLGRVSRAYYGGRLDRYRQQFTDERQAREAYQAFMLGAVGHEFAHALSELRHAEGRDHPWREETRAVDFELAVLNKLVALGRLAPGTLGRWEQFNRALLGAAPPGLVASLPKTASERETLFNQLYPRLLDGAAGEGKAPEPEAAHAIDTVLALYTLYRLERLKAPIDLGELRHALDPPRDPAPLRTLARAELESRSLKVVSAESEANLRTEVGATVPGWLLEVVTHEAEPRSIVLRSWRNEAVPPARRAVVTELVARLGAKLVLDACEIDPDQGTVWLQTPLALGDDPRADFVRAAVERHLALVRRWAGAVDLVATGKLAPRAALEQAAEAGPAAPTSTTPAAGSGVEPPKPPPESPTPPVKPGPPIRDRGF